MDKKDTHDFGVAMTRLFAIYGEALTDNLLSAWWGVLSSYALDEVKLAMNHHAKDPAAGRFRPTPADIIRHLTETIPAARRLAADALRRDYTERLGLLVDAQLRDATDCRLGLISPEENTERQKRHAGAVRALRAEPKYGRVLARDAAPRREVRGLQRLDPSDP
jgi:hypothetical protein